MKIVELIEMLKNRFPEEIMESYDNTGVQVLFHEDEIKKIYISLDADMATLQDAIDRGCNLIVSHHPLLFRPVKKLLTSETRSRVIINMIAGRVSLYSIHTNFDRIMFRALAEFLGYRDTIPLLNVSISDSGETGFGSITKLPVSITLGELMLNIKTRLGLNYLVYSGTINKIVRTIAFLNGSGGGSIEHIIQKFCPDCIVTGDVNYHHIKYAMDSGICIIDAGHFGTEIIFKKILAESVKNVLNDETIDIIISDVEKNPFKVFT